MSATPGPLPSEDEIRWEGWNTPAAEYWKEQCDAAVLIMLENRKQAEREKARSAELREALRDLLAFDEPDSVADQAKDIRLRIERSNTVNRARALLSRLEEGK